MDHRLFTFMYMGNIGAVAGVDHLIRSFHRAKLANAQLIIGGGGAQRAVCQELVRGLNVGNVRFLSDPDSRNVPKLQSLADVLLLPMKRGEASSSIPSKLAAYMFSGKPIIATVDAGSATAKAIIDSQCGWVGMPEDETWLAERMRVVMKLTHDELLAFGRRARTYGMAHFSKAEGVNKLARILAEAARPT